MKILGTIVNDKMSWDDNCQHLMKKVNARMQLLRSVQSFGAKHSEMVHLWTVFCRSVLEQSCAVWHSSLTQENIDDLERTQKSFCKIVLKEHYKSYESALLILDMDSLQERRQKLQLKFAKSGIKFNKLNDLCKYWTTEKIKHNINAKTIKHWAQPKQEKENGWYIIPGKLDNVSYYLLIFFVISIMLLVFIQIYI